MWAFLFEMTVLVYTNIFLHYGRQNDGISKKGNKTTPKRHVEVKILNTYPEHRPYQFEEHSVTPLYISS